MMTKNKYSKSSVKYRMEDLCDFSLVYDLIHMPQSVFVLLSCVLIQNYLTRHNIIVLKKKIQRLVFDNNLIKNII